MWYRITHPTATDNFVGVGGIQFTDGSAVVNKVSDAPIVAYARRHGYTVQLAAPPSEVTDTDPADQDDDVTDYTKWRVADLKDYASAKKIDFDSTMKKADLILLIEAYDADADAGQPATDDDPADDDSQLDDAE